MRKCKIKAPKYAFGAKEIGGVLNSAGNIALGINGGNQTAQAVFNGIDLTLGNIPVIGKFAKIAAGIGKIGTAIAGTKGSVDETTGEITEGSGILGRKNRHNLYQLSGIVKNNIAAALNSARVAADWYADNGYNQLSYARGGVIPNTLAYLDDGETGRTPDGLIFNVPENGKPTDSNLMNVPVGTQILSDKLKPKGSKDTYAKMYEKNKARTNMKGKDIYALNSKMLNDRYNQSLYDLYLAMLEGNKKGKSKIGKYDEGTAGVKDKKDRSLMPGAKFIEEPTLKLNYDLIKGKMPKSNINAPISPIRSTTQDDKWGWLDNLERASVGLIGPLANITAKKGPTNVPYTYTPKFGPTDYNIKPLLNLIDNTYSMANYNMANLNPNTGAGMAYGLLAAINRDKLMAQAYAEKNNQETKMAMLNADIYNQWGKFNANAQHTAAVENALDLAATETVRRQGWSDLSTALQTMSKDKRLTKRDMMIMAAMKPYLSKGMTSDQIDKIYSYLQTV